MGTIGPNPDPLFVLRCWFLPLQGVLLALCYKLRPLRIVLGWKVPPSQGHFSWPRVQHAYSDWSMYYCSKAQIPWLKVDNSEKSFWVQNSAWSSVCIIVQPFIGTGWTEEISCTFSLITFDSSELLFIYANLCRNWEIR